MATTDGHKRKLKTAGLRGRIQTLEPLHSFSEEVKCAHDGKQHVGSSKN